MDKKNIKKSKKEPSIKQYLTYRRAMKLLVTLKNKFKSYRWDIIYVDEGTPFDAKVKITYKSYSDSMMTSVELSELLYYIMELKVHYYISFYPSSICIIDGRYPNKFTINVKVID